MVVEPEGRRCNGIAGTSHQEPGKSTDMSLSIIYQPAIDSLVVIDICHLRGKLQYRLMIIHALQSIPTLEYVSVTHLDPAYLAMNKVIELPASAPKSLHINTTVCACSSCVRSWYATRVIHMSSAFPFPTKYAIRIRNHETVRIGCHYLCHRSMLTGYV